MKLFFKLSYFSTEKLKTTLHSEMEFFAALGTETHQAEGKTY